MADILLEVQDLSFSYEERQVLRKITFQVHAGERIAVLGANGAGKSTLFLNLNGVRIPQSGEIRYRGEKIEKKNRRLLQKKIGIVFQDADNQMVASTVRAEIAFGPMNMHLDKAQVAERVRKAMQTMQLEAYGERPPHYLSGGEKKKVAIADILAMEPELIIFDEPTAALDPVNARMLEQVLRTLEQEGKTILLSTHDVDFAWRFADRILLLQEGRLIADDRPEVIFRNSGLLRQTNLTRPMLLQVWDELVSRGSVSAGEPPRDFESFRRQLDGKGAGK